MTECAVCGSHDEPDGGWFYRRTDVSPSKIEDGSLKWEPTDDADPLCSVECVNTAKNQGPGHED